MNRSDSKTDKKRLAQYLPLVDIGRIALRCCGIEPAEFQFISDTGNVIFRADTVAGSFCIRIYPKLVYTAAEISGELNWLSALREATDLLVPEPVSTLTGEWVQLLETAAGEFHQIVIFRWLPGEIVGRNISPEIAVEMGGVMAQLHEHAAGFQLPAGCFRDDSDWRGMGHLQANMSEIQRERIGSFLTEKQILLCDRAAGKAAEVIAAADTTQHHGLVHSDLHSKNCVMHKHQLGVIDFDDCQIAPFTHDFAISLSSFDNASHAEALRNALIRGYEAFRPWTNKDTDEIDAFMMERRLRLIRWVSTWPHINYHPSGQALITQALEHSQRYLAQG